MNEALRSHRNQLERDLQIFSDFTEAVKEGRHQFFTVDAATGKRVDTTPEAVVNFENIIAALKSSVRDLNIKLGEPE